MNSTEECLRRPPEPSFRSALEDLSDVNSRIGRLEDLVRGQGQVIAAQAQRIVNLERQVRGRQAHFR